MEIARAPLAAGAVDSVDVAGSPSPSAVSSITVDRLGEALIPPPEHRLSGERLAVLASLAGAGAIVLGGIAMATTLGSSSSDTPPTTPSTPTVASSPSELPGTSARIEAAVAFLARPSTRRIPFANSGGRIVLAVGPGGRGVLALHGLRPATAGSAYVAWLVGRKGRIVGRAGVFSGRTSIVPLTRGVPIGSAVAVTLEHAAGKAPTRQLRLVARRDVG